MKRPSIPSSKKALVNLFQGGKKLFQSISWGWLIWGVVLFFALLVWRFPYERLLLYYAHDALAQHKIQMHIQKLEYDFPLSFRFKELHLHPRGNWNSSFYDTQVKADASVLWQDHIQGQFKAAGARFRQEELFVRTNASLVGQVNNYSLPLSRIEGQFHLQLKQTDLADLRQLLQKNPKSQQIISMLGDKIPSKLHFSKIDIQAKLKDKKLTITQGNLQGKEINGKISGRIILNPNKLVHSRLFLNIVILHTSPIWKKLETELSLLKGFKVVDQKGDLKLPLRGTLKKPKAILPQKSPMSSLMKK